MTLILSGVNEAETASDVSAGGVAVFKMAMMGVPLVLVALSWLVLSRTYRLDERTYAGIVADFSSREAALTLPPPSTDPRPVVTGGTDDEH